MLLNDDNVRSSGQALGDVGCVSFAKLVDPQDVIALIHADKCPVLKYFYFVWFLACGYDLNYISKAIFSSL